MHPLRPAVFLDRDGTINEEVHYLSDPEHLRLLPGAAEGIRLLNRVGVPVFVVTNQAGVGRGYFTAEVVEAIHERLVRELADRGARIDGFAVCPHHPDDGCDCRKPQPGMLLSLAREHGLDLSRSVMVGDKLSDLEAGRAAGCRTVLVRTGYGAEEFQRRRPQGRTPDHVASDLQDTAAWIIGQVVEPRPGGSPPFDP